MRRLGVRRMRKLIFLAAVLSSFLFCFSDARGEDWRYYHSYNDLFYYDKENINAPYDDFKSIISIWQRIIYDQESIDRIAEHLGNKYADLMESVSLIEIDCFTRYIQIKAVTFYNSKGRVIDTSYRVKPDWKAIPSESPMNKLFKAVCSLQENG
jgi:hypothetical protein